MTFRTDAFRRALINWYHKNGRDLPWRRTHDPYAILVSEFMLQQTQVATVIPFYHCWLRRFPDFDSLARAAENDVLHAWQGLGYYARARNLHATAKIVQDRHRGKFPRGIEEMRRLPGVGKYTAHAVASFAFNQSVPIVEANTARVLARFFNVRVPIDSPAGCTRLWQLAAELLPKRGAANFNSALLDLGALVCLPRAPKCALCPVEEFCRAKDPQFLPIKKARPRLKRLVENHAFVLRRGKLLLGQSRNRWRGMWILPPATFNGSNRAVYEGTFPFTHHRITLKVFRQRARNVNKQTQRWFSIDALATVPMPSPHRRAAEALLIGSARSGLAETARA